MKKEEALLVTTLALDAFSEVSKLMEERDAALADAVEMRKIILENHEEQIARMRDDYGFTYSEELLRRTQDAIDRARQEREEK